MVVYDFTNQSRQNLGVDGALYEADTCFIDSLGLFESSENLLETDVRIGITLTGHLSRELGSLQIHGQTVEVTVAADPSMLDRCIAKMKRRAWRKPAAVGVMVTDPNALILSVETYCLIVLLRHFRYIPISLKNFLTTREIHFLGVRGYHFRLSKNLGSYMSRVCVVLGPFVAGVTETPHLHFSANWRELASAVGVRIDDPPMKLPINWDAPHLTTEAISSNIYDSYTSHLLGERLLRSIQDSPERTYPTRI